MADANGNEHDEFTPRERGLMLGHRTALAVGRGAIEFRVREDDDEPLSTPTALRALCEDPPRIPEGLYGEIMGSGMRERLDATDDPDDAESEFWYGFRDGARAYVAEVRFGTDN